MLNYQGKGVHSTFGHLKIITCYHNYYRCKIRQHVQFHSFFYHRKNHFFHQSRAGKKTNHEGIDIILTSLTKHFHKRKVTYNPCIYKAPNLQKSSIMLHVRSCGPKKCYDCRSTWPKPFLPQLSTMICLNNIISKD